MRSKLGEGLNCLSKDLHLTHTLPTSPHFLFAPGQFHHESFLWVYVRHWETIVSCCPLWYLFVQCRGLIQKAVGKDREGNETEWQGKVLSGRGVSKATLHQTHVQEGEKKGPSTRGGHGSVQCPTATLAAGDTENGCGCGAEISPHCGVTI